MKTRLDRQAIAMRVAKELKDDDCVNLGVGIPTLVSSHVFDKDIIFHTENGIIGFGPVLTIEDADKMDYDLINAYGEFLAPLPGMSVVDHAFSFSLVRGGRLDVAILGGLQVSEEGDLANWGTDSNWRRKGARLGGAMDIAAGAKKIIVAMEHITRDGQPKIVKKLTYPITAKKCVNMVFTDLAVIEIVGKGLLLKEIAPGWTPAEVQAVTEANLIISEDIKEIEL